jgi:hypothetical protein
MEVNAAGKVVGVRYDFTHPGTHDTIDRMGHFPFRYVIDEQRHPA